MNTNTPIPTGDALSRTSPKVRELAARHAKADQLRVRRFFPDRHSDRAASTGCRNAFSDSVSTAFVSSRDEKRERCADRGPTKQCVFSAQTGLIERECCEV
ncbi:hypothetical protein M8J76_010157 [Diaphorina citri]|nr:hypothetical protein M8J76_010157 [Diaphorina citri]